MIVGREKELRFLNQYYEREGHQILVVYGQRGVGKTALLSCFVENKISFLYAARPCGAREQRYQWACELREQNKDISRYPEYEEILQSIFEPKTDKQILVIEEFQNIVKNDDTFMPELIRSLENRRFSRPVMIVLSSSASGWVENHMFSRMGSLAASISGLLKVKELSYENLSEIFPDYSVDDSIKIYAALGGIPGLWSYFSPQLTAKENFIHNFLRKGAHLQDEIFFYMGEELREPAIYNSILATMVDGCSKLNDIYRHTGFSRAKISVYLKNLMEIELVEKVFAGTYRISNPYVRFYFRFLFPHKSSLNVISSEEYYNKYVKDAYTEYVEEAYRSVCKEKLLQEYTNVEEWCWKPGNVYLKAENQQEVAVVTCSYGNHFTQEDREWLLFSMKKVGLKAERIILMVPDEGGNLWKKVCL